MATHIANKENISLYKNVGEETSNVDSTIYEDIGTYDYPQADDYNSVERENIHKFIADTDGEKKNDKNVYETPLNECDSNAGYLVLFPDKNLKDNNQQYTGIISSSTDSQHRRGELGHNTIQRHSTLTSEKNPINDGLENVYNIKCVDSNMTNKKIICVSVVVIVIALVAAIGITFIVLKSKTGENQEELLHVIQNNAVCPGGWIEHDSNCYFFSESAKNWEDAGHFCQLFSSRLAEPRTNSTSKFIIGHARKRGDNFWLGISDIFQESQWIYSSDMTRIIISDWDASQPNQGRGSNCLCTWVRYNSFWVDEPCFPEYKFVCERPLTVNGKEVTTKQLELKQERTGLQQDNVELQLANFKQEIADLRQQCELEEQSPIAFSAALYDKTYASDRLVLGKMITKIGDGYDSAKGMFVCPRSGLYLFSLTITTYDSKTASARLMKNDGVLRDAYSIIYGTANSTEKSQPTSSLTVVISLRKGDKIWVKGKGEVYHSNTVFTGVYIGK